MWVSQGLNEWEACDFNPTQSTSSLHYQSPLLHSIGCHMPARSLLAVCIQFEWYVKLRTCLKAYNEGKKRLNSSVWNSSEMWSGSKWHQEKWNNGMLLAVKACLGIIVVLKRLWLILVWHYQCLQSYLKKKILRYSEICKTLRNNLMIL